jgi:hypothetical protein
MTRRLRLHRLQQERNRGMAMKLRLTTSAFSIVLLASLAGAQAASSAKKSAAKPAATTAAKAAPAATAKPAVKSTTKPTAKPAAKSKAPAAAKAAHPAAKAVHHAAKAPAPAAATTAAPAAAAEPSHKRDPFVNPVQAVREGASGACQGGKRCLAVTEIVLRGVVKAPNGMIAVVENSAQRTYFLRENDPIFNGIVQKITPDSVTFREHYTDNLGRDAQRDITKTVNAPVV